MDEPHIAIIGCGAGGGTAAQFARKTNRKNQITIFEQSPYAQYSRCGLPYVISGAIPSPSDLLEFTQEWFAKEHITVHLQTTVESIDLQQKKLTVSHKGQHTQHPFDRLILATGSHPLIPPIQGIPKEGPLPPRIFCLRSIDDAVKIQQSMQQAKHACIVGAGFIGLELTEALTEKGLAVTVVEALPNILAASLDSDLSEQVAASFPSSVTILLKHFVTKVTPTPSEITVHTKDRTSNQESSFNTDFVVLATGTRPEVPLAKALGCALGPTGGIVINARCETSIPGVYAVGDCTEYKDFVTGQPVCIGLGSIAVRQGITAGTNAAGGSYEMPPGVLLSRTSTFFGTQIAAVGPLLTPQYPKPLVHGKINGSSLPTYFPGGKPITVKVSAEEESGRIVAAQAVGSNASQRMNVYACAILQHATVDSFQKLETTYAPPIAPTLDVLTLACDVVQLKRTRKKRER